MMNTEQERKVTPSLKCLLIPKQVSCLFPSLYMASSIDQSNQFIYPCAVMRDGEIEINAKGWRRKKGKVGRGRGGTAEREHRKPRASEHFSNSL